MGISKWGLSPFIPSDFAIRKSSSIKLRRSFRITLVPNANRILGLFVHIRQYIKSTFLGDRNWWKNGKNNVNELARSGRGILMNQRYNFYRRLCLGRARTGVGMNSGITLFKYSSNFGTVKALSPYAGAYTIPFEIIFALVGAT